MGEQQKNSGERDSNPFISSERLFDYWSEAHCLAAEQLDFAIGRDAPLTLLIGKYGSGKSTVVRKFIAETKTQQIVGMVSHYSALNEAPRAAVFRALGAVPSRDTGDLDPDLFEASVRRSHTQYGLPTLIVDDAHEMTQDILQELMEVCGTRTDELLLKLVLVGQPSLKVAVSEAWTSMVCPTVELGDMSEEDTGGFVHHRCAVAGLTTMPFTSKALTALHDMSEGNPLQLNLIGMRVLDAACAERLSLIDADFVMRLDSRPKINTGQQSQSARDELTDLLHAVQDEQKGPAQTVEKARFGSEAPPSDRSKTSAPPVVEGDRMTPSNDKKSAPHDDIGPGDTTNGKKPKSNPKSNQRAKHEQHQAEYGEPTTPIAKPDQDAPQTTEHAPTSVAPGSHPLNVEPTIGVGSSPTSKVTASTSPPNGVSAGEKKRQKESHSNPPRKSSETSDAVHADGSAVRDHDTPSPKAPEVSPKKYEASSNAAGRLDQKSTPEEAKGSQAPNPSLGDLPFLQSKSAESISKKSANDDPPVFATKLGNDLTDLPAPKKGRKPKVLGVLSVVSVAALAVIATWTFKDSILVLNDIRELPVSEATLEVEVDLKLAADNAAPAPTLEAPPLEPLSDLAINTEDVSRIQSNTAILGPLPDETSDLFRLALDVSAENPEAAGIAYALAASKGHHRAAYYLGQMFETGEEVPVDLHLANHWYKVAAETIESAKRATVLAEEASGNVSMSAPVHLYAAFNETGKLDFVWTSAEGEDPKGYNLVFSDHTGNEVSAKLGLTHNVAHVRVPDEATHWRVEAVSAAGALAFSESWVPLPAAPGTLDDKLTENQNQPNR